MMDLGADLERVWIARLTDLEENSPAAAEADGVDLVLVRRGEAVHVLEGRCPHRGAPLADGRVEGTKLLCGVHGWEFQLESGISAYKPSERIHRFRAHVADGQVFLEKDELVEFSSAHPERPAVSVYQ